MREQESVEASTGDVVKEGSSMLATTFILTIVTIP